jgi:hypothetical protein
MIKNTLPKAFIILIHTVPLNVVVLNNIENTINTDAMIPIISKNIIIKKISPGTLFLIWVPGDYKYIFSLIYLAALLGL